MSNDAQIAYWNGEVAERWAREQETLDAVFGVFSDAALERAAARPGERVLDVGCGCGATTIALARAVGNEGSVVGVDVSEPMLARARARAAGIGQVELVLADASTYVPPAPVDLVFSRFGVMFFAEAAASFAHMARQLRPGGRIAFVSWRALSENEWATVPMLATRDVFPPMTAADPDAPGPFSFGDRARVERVLAAAGLVDARIDALDAELVLSEHGLDEAVAFAMQTGPTARRARESDEPTRERAAAAVRAALEPLMKDNRVALGGAVWIVSALSS